LKKEQEAEDRKVAEKNRKWKKDQEVEERNEVEERTGSGRYSKWLEVSGIESVVS
jgi:hypothetical protein